MHPDLVPDLTQGNQGPRRKRGKWPAIGHTGGQKPGPCLTLRTSPCLTSPSPYSFRTAELSASLQLVPLPAVGPQHPIQPIPRVHFSAQASVLFLIALVAPLDCKLQIKSPVVFCAPLESLVPDSISSHSCCSLPHLNHPVSLVSFSVTRPALSGLVSH